ncbi:MAG: RNA polymerase sigma factor [Planctomycetaceae bacterium]|nr:MAG: RNA polymerase sigma factor [Planctomycetaceae bacterium]
MSRESDLRQTLEKQYTWLLRFACRLCGSLQEAEDLVQQAAARALEREHQLQCPEACLVWLFSIVRNEYLQLRRRKVREQFLEELDPESVPEEEAPEAAWIDEEQLQQALQELPEAYRTPLILFYFRVMSYQHIAEVMQVPLGTVMSRLARAKAYLRKRLAAPDPWGVRRPRLSAPSCGGGSP